MTLYARHVKLKPLITNNFKIEKAALCTIFWFSELLYKYYLLYSSKLHHCKQRDHILKVTLGQWFPNFFGARTTLNILVLREAQNIDLYRDWRTT
jgi:hypothetical protein